MKLPKSYTRLKKYALVVEDICKDIDFCSLGYDPGVSFWSKSGHSLDLPEWFLERLYEYVTKEEA